MEIKIYVYNLEQEVKIFKKVTKIPLQDQFPALLYAKRN